MPATTRLIAQPEYSLLLVIDVQERLCNAMPEFTEVSTRIEQSVKVASLLGIPTIVTEQYPQGLGPTLSVITDALGEKFEVYEKTAFACWGSAAFAAAVQAWHPRSLIIVGMETHVCVQQTVLGALDRGYHTVLLADAVCSRNAADRQVALQLLQNRGATITTVEAAAFDWLQDAAHPLFKPISKLFRGK